MQFATTSRRTILLTSLLLTIGALGGGLAQWAGWPMPWMLGALLASGLAARFAPERTFADYSFPIRFRTFFVGLIGVMIGSQVTPDLLALAPDLPLALVALLLFVPAAHLGNMLIFRRIGRYDRPTAFFSAAPGGLMESIAFGEANGADLRILTIQQFLRIILVISLLPIGLKLWTGQAVGSAAGLSASGPETAVSLSALVLIIAVAALGVPLARLLRLPAPQLTGPLLLASAATLSGALDLHLPFWLIATAQLVIGGSLGIRFRGIDAALLRRTVALSLISVGYMLALGGALAWALHLHSGIPFLHLLIAYAPGGVAEMSLVALSLAANPALVSLIHVTRILLTVVEMPLAARLFGMSPKATPPNG